MLKVGTKAPDFTLADQEGQEISLVNFRGKKVVLYFYPKDNKKRVLACWLKLFFTSKSYSFSTTAYNNDLVGHCLYPNRGLL